MDNQKIRVYSHQNFLKMQ